MPDSIERNENKNEVGVGAVSRLFAVLRSLGDTVEGGERVTQLAQRIGLSQPTTHRLLRSLMDEGMVEQDARSKRCVVGCDKPMRCASWVTRSPPSTVSPRLRSTANSLETAPTPTSFLFSFRSMESDM